MNVSLNGKQTVEIIVGYLVNNFEFTSEYHYLNGHQNWTYKWKRTAWMLYSITRCEKGYTNIKGVSVEEIKYRQSF